MKLTKLGAASVAIMMMAGTLLASEVDIDGASPGKWTMDFDAAQKVASEKELPILLDFSGSDWCGWCQLMEENVFTKTEWEEWAQDHIMVVLIDFPSDESLVPEKYKERNQTLNAQYGIEGLPTFILLDTDGQTELGRLGAGEEKTPASFIGEIKVLLENSASKQQKLIDSLSPEKKAEYEKLQVQLLAANEKLEAQTKAIQEAQDATTQTQLLVMEIEGNIELFRMEQKLDADNFKTYKELKVKHDAAFEKLRKWIESEPEQTQENFALYQEMRDEIQKMEEQLSQY